MRVHSTHLQFTRDGRRLVVANDDKLTVIDVHTVGQHTMSMPDTQAIAVFDDQIWVATLMGVLRRLGLDGRVIDEHPLTPDPNAILSPTVIGPPAALWTARAPAVLLEDLGQLSSTPVDFDVHAAIPIAGRQVAHFAGPRVTLPSGLAVKPSASAQLLGGGVILDGTALALVADQPQGRTIFVVTRASGSLQRAIAIPPGEVRLASRRGLAVIRDPGGQCVLVDLRFGRSLGAGRFDDDILDMAIDPDGRGLARLLASGKLDLVPIDERRGARGSTIHSVAPAASEPVSAAPSASTPALEVVTESSAATLSMAPPAPVNLALRVDALEPRRPRERLPRPQALAALDRELRSVRLWTVRAIAIAWDSKRIGYGNEGAHPYEHEVAGLLGLGAGYARDQVERAEQALAAHELALAADPERRAPASPIAELRDEFGLSDVAIDVLLTIAAPTLDGHMARLYGIGANDNSRPIVDQLLVQTVLMGRHSAHDVGAELEDRSPLVRLGIVQVDRARPSPFASLTVDRVVLSRLRGEIPDLGTVPIVRQADRELADLALAPGVLLSAAAALDHATRPARIAVRGRVGAGRRTLLAAIAAKANRALGVIEATRLPRDAERFVIALETALRRAQLAGMLPVVCGLEAVAPGERTGGDVARDVLAAHPGPLAVLIPPVASPPLPLGHVVIDLPALSETERLAVWGRALDGTGRWLRDAAGLAARYRVGPGIIHRAVAAATTVDVEPTTPADERIEGFLRQARNVRLGDHARRVEKLATWANLVLPPDVLDSLREFIGRVRHRRTVYEQWGMTSVMATSRGLTALFQGQPGTGKTLVAGVIARELGLDLYQVDLSKVMSKWIGETERNLATIFDAAEDGQAILLFDEADSLFAKRTEVRSSNDRYANLEVNYLLQRLDAFEGIAILTTNAGGAIDPAFKRRLSFQLTFPFPDEETRAALWKAHLPPSLPRGEELEFTALARKFELSGGYIRNACLRAAFLAAQEEVPLRQHHLERAVKLEYAEMGKLSAGGAMQ